MAKVSVVIPTYNREDSLSRAIESVLRQTEPVHEVLVCDDGSTDSSKSIVASIAETDHRVRWLDCGRNGRPAIPRNRGIVAATGDWVAFLDSDDEWLPSKIEVQIHMLEQTKAHACSANALCIRGDADAGLVHSTDNATLTFEKLLRSNQNICSSVVVRRTLLEETATFPEEKELKGVEDYELWLRLALVTDFHYIHTPLVKYYDSPTTSIRSEVPSSAWQLKVIVLHSLLRWLQQSAVRPMIRQQVALRLSYIDALRKTGHSYQQIAHELVQ